MRILKQGIKPEDVDYEATCRYCKTVIEFKQAESEIVFDQRDGNFMKIICPTCGKLITKNM